MGNTRPSSSPPLPVRWRRTLELVLVEFVPVTFIAWDGISLTRDHTVEVWRLSEELMYLQNLLEDLKNYPRDSGLSIQLGSRISEPTKVSTDEDDPTNFRWREPVKDAMIHAWSSYEKYAWSQDELQVENVIIELHRTFPLDGLLPIYINPHTGATSSSVFTFGAMGDSFYEYLLKAWIQGNKTEAVNHYREMWETSMEDLKSLIPRTTPSSFAYICEKNGRFLSDEMDELACFAPGMLALASYEYGLGEADKYLSLAEEILFEDQDLSVVLKLGLMASDEESIERLEARLGEFQKTLSNFKVDMNDRLYR